MKKFLLTKLCFIFSFTIVLFCLSSCSKSSDDSTSFLGDSNAAFDSFGSTGKSFSYQAEGYNDLEENAFISVDETSTSTFSVDADGASYSNVRRFLNDAELPPAGAIRTEELINYFPFNYEQPDGQHPIALNGEISSCPWNSEHKLLRIGIQGKDIPIAELPATNYVLLIDVSGSMRAENKLDLLKESFKVFADQLTAADKVAIVTYSGAVATALPATSGNETETIKEALSQLEAGGSTAGGAAIVTAYEIAEANFIAGGNNRVILATDGDFNVGLSSQDELVSLIEEKRELGVFLTVVGVGAGNLKDGIMEQVANNGNGTYEYIDNIAQAEKVFIHEFKKFHTVGKDVKVQINFNPSHIKEYRLIGYENRLLAEEDFVDDEVDAGEIGANQSITALYELIPQDFPSTTGAAVEILFRYKLPEESFSIETDLNVFNGSTPFEEASENMRFAASVAAYGMLLRDSDYYGAATYEQTKIWAQDAATFDPYAYRSSFLDLISIAEGL